MSGAKNVLGTPLKPCSMEPLTGFYRNGCCDTGVDDLGLHTICVQVTAEFLRDEASEAKILQAAMAVSAVH